MNLTLPVVLVIEHIGRFGASLLIIVIPRPRPFSSAAAIIILRVLGEPMLRPQPETGPEPRQATIGFRKLAIGHKLIDGFANQRGPGFTPLLR